MTFWHRRTRRKLETTDYFFVADRDSEEGRLIVRSAVDVGFHSGRGAAAFIISCTSGLNCLHVDPRLITTARRE